MLVMAFLSNNRGGVSFPSPRRTMLSTLFGSVHLLQQGSYTKTHMEGMALPSQPPRRTKLVAASKQHQQASVVSNVTANVALYTGMVFLSLGVTLVWTKMRLWMVQWWGRESSSSNDHEDALLCSHHSTVTDIPPESEVV